MVGKFRNLRFWAENGLIKMLDESTGEEKVLTIREFLLRIKAINDSIPKLQYYDEKVEHSRFVEEALTICRIAKEQRARSATIVVPFVSSTKDNND
jgi:hypothetical protein